MTAAVHQFVPTLEPGAVGNHVVRLQRLLRDQGYESEIFAEHLRMDHPTRGRPFRHYASRYPARPDDVLIYHLAIGSDVADFVMQRKEQLIVDHHNVTPPRYFERWQPELVHGVAWGLRQLDALACRTALGIADSEFNRAELEHAGYGATAVSPLLLDLDALRGEVDEAVRSRLEDAKTGGGSDWLFVGRVVPNKCQHDVVRAFAVYRRLYDHAARLSIVGASSSPAYWEAVRRLVDTLGLGGAVQLTGGLTDGAVAAHFATADVFVCLSEHEGFCIPIVEAWANDLPVVALRAAAVGETVGDGGLLLTAKPATTVAAAVHRVLTDSAVRNRMLQGGRRRLAWYEPAAAEQRVLAALAPVLGDRR